VIHTISEIADPSIIPALEEAVRRRTEKFPERFRNVEENLPRYLAEFTDQIRSRHPDWDERGSSEPEQPRRAAPEKAAPPSEAEAEKSQDPESIESSEASKSSLALWTAAVAGALAVAALAARRRAAKR